MKTRQTIRLALAFLCFTVAARTQTLPFSGQVTAAYVNPAGTGWSPLTGVGGAGQLNYTPDNRALLYVFNGSGWIPWTGASGSGFIASLTTTGTSGAATVTSGVLNIPIYTGGATAFSAITGATNTTAAMVCGTGCSIGVSGSGTNTATAAPLAGLTGLGAGVGTFLATPSSANFAAAVTGETGSGALVFATSPTLVTPVLGVATATSINGTTIPASVTLTQTIASGATALGTGAITSGSCATVVTATATGTATTDVVSWSFNGDVTAVTGYAPVTTGGVALYVYPTANTFNVKVCNPTSSSITPGAVTLNWKVVR